MSRQLPVNQVRLTNVAVVRLSRAGHRFEVACYRNKILNYRQGTETDLSEVLQTERVFTNVSKGQFANSKILQQCFETTDELAVCRYILDKGDVQISDQERAAQHESTIREVASMVSEEVLLLVHAPGAELPGMAGGPRWNDGLRCSWRDGSSSSSDHVARTIDLLVKEGVSRSDILPPNRGDSNRQQTRIVFQSDPSLYRKIETIARDASVRGRLEIMQQCVTTEEGDVTLGSELERRAQQKQQRQQQDDDAIVQAEGALNASSVPSTSGDNNVDQTLSNNLKSTLTIDDSDDENQNNDSQILATNNNSRKAQKAAQKKSKKAKRREKEEHAERGERIAAEKTRQRERAERLGIVEGDGSTTALSSENNVIQQGGDGAVQGTDVKPCNTCGGAFTSGEYRMHFRSDWHRYNVKLKMKNVPPVSEQEFLLCDSDAFFEL
ncbi:hypothetical protein ACHAWU_007542 [Discostella pseudostelligera]|uniref:Ribosome maturation protein SDO1/SBDS N-terminal domain-containing protein n=1 Tax=Discostella pseudostelligera TaxID=259834 RepID=A0ABD3M795_9STRA